LRMQRHGGVRTRRSRQSPIGGLVPKTGATFPSYEDAFLWFDTQSKRWNWNCLFHQYQGKGKGGASVSGPGGYACSTSEDILGEWTWAVSNGSTVYDFTSQLANGGSIALQKRERPKLLLDATGRPLVLYNGISFGGESHTFAQRVTGWRLPYMRHAYV
jgi:hypothetical protein